MIETNKIYCMDCLDGMKLIDDNTFDSIVTDPPYELGFMNKSWDKTGIAYNILMWKEVLRVLKPGGHLLSFGGSRTYHRMACAIEDAGFEIRDQIMWIFGGGFPKGLNMGLAVAKINGGEIKQGDLKWKKHNTLGIMNDDGWQSKDVYEKYVDNDWSGWGTSLKPAHEPIVMARKPLSEKTIAENVLKWGTGGINIDASRIGNRGGVKHDDGEKQDNNIILGKGLYKDFGKSIEGLGRFPSNVIHDGSKNVESEFEKAGTSGSNVRKNKADGKSSIFGSGRYQKALNPPDDFGTPSRFFKSCKYSDEDAASFYYTAKAQKDERDMGCEELEENEVCRAGHENDEKDDVTQRFITKIKNIHPTVKPLSLMEYLVKLITPPKGLVLDPFIGSGTTAIACKKFGMNFIGFEINEEYCKIAEKRIMAVPKRLDKFI